MYLCCNHWRDVHFLSLGRKYYNGSPIDNFMEILSLKKVDAESIYFDWLAQDEEHTVSQACATKMFGMERQEELLFNAFSFIVAS